MKKRKLKRRLIGLRQYLLESEKTIEREFRPFSKIKDHYPKYIIMNQFDRSRDGVKHINLLDFLTEELN